MIEIKVEESWQFVNRVLKSGRRICEFVGLAVNKRKPKRVLTFLHDGTEQARILDFENGGLDLVTNRKDLLSPIIMKFLARSPNNCALFESMASPNDPAIKDKRTRFFSIDDETILYVIATEVSKEMLQDVLTWAADYPFTCVLTHATDVQMLAMKNNKIRDSTLKEMVDSTEMLVLGAYDEEGYLLVELA